MKTPIIEAMESGFRTCEGIANVTGIDKRHVATVLKRLEDMGMCQRSRRTVKTGGRPAHLWVLK